MKTRALRNAISIALFAMASGAAGAVGAQAATAEVATGPQAAAQKTPEAVATNSDAPPRPGPPEPAIAAAPPAQTAATELESWHDSGAGGLGANNGYGDVRDTAAGIARTFQNVRLFNDMSVLENVMVGRHVRTRNGLWAALSRHKRAREEEKQTRELAWHWLEYTGIAKFAHYRACDLAYGHQRRLEIARALATDPLLLALDEPAAGMNAAEKVALGELLIRLRDDGKTLLISAARYGNEESVRFLLENGADPNKPNGKPRLGHYKPANSETALWVLADVSGLQENSINATAKLLIEHKADVNFRARGGATPLDRAIAT